MTRNLKLLGIAVGAMIALGAAASAASAAEFHSEVSLTTLAGEQISAFNDEFTTDAGQISCKKLTYKGELNGATNSTAVLEPTYSECLATFGLNSPIDPNECKYILHANSNQVTISCPTGKVIAITAPGCEVTVPGQAVPGTTYTNQGSGTGRDITVDTELTGIQYTEHNKGFFPTCADNTVWKANGVYHGITTIKGSKSGAQVGIWYQ